MKFKMPKGFPRLIKVYRPPSVYRAPKMGTSKAPKIYKCPKAPKFK